MGKHFGHLIKIRGVTFYCLSPNELKPFKGMINPGFFNLIRRIRENIFYVGTGAAIVYSTYSFGKSENEKLHRKNPNDYKDDQ